jgi:7-cyano-7-deazaguanine synthase in queuosine biosynthesis
MRYRILCMYSGGIDSTGMLYKLLTDKQYSDYDIHVHFVVNMNREKRYVAEMLAVKNCLAWFRNNCRSFIYTENTMDFSFLKGAFPWDSDIINFTAGEIVILSSYLYKYVTIGQTKTDFERINDTTRINKTRKILDLLLSIYDKKVEKIYPLIDLTKTEIWNMIPVELRKNTWSCRNPIYVDGIPVVCGKCITCNEMKTFKIGFYE